MSSYMHPVVALRRLEDQHKEAVNKLINTLFTQEDLSDSNFRCAILEEKRKVLGLSKIDFARYLNITRKTFNNYLDKITPVPMVMITALPAIEAEIRGEMKPLPESVFEQKAEFRLNLADVLNFMSRESICEYLGLPHWQNVLARCQNSRSFDPIYLRAIRTLLLHVTRENSEVLLPNSGE